jgi:acetoin:2,6-dichlorophenolindophenol oxidoreductase subunit alpha
VNEHIFKIAEPFGIKNQVLDGNDVLQVYETGRKAVAKCRSGEGPVFLECLTYRFRGHVGPDDNIQGSRTDIRPKQEVEQWLQKDPIKRFERYLLNQGLLEEEALNKLKKDVERDVADAHAFAKKSPAPDGKELMRYVFA